MFMYELKISGGIEEPPFATHVRNGWIHWAHSRLGRQTGYDLGRVATYDCHRNDNINATTIYAYKY